MSFRREKGVPRGGPNGGRGGNGGSIYFVPDKNINSLAYFRFHPLVKAQKGAHGEGGNRHGKKGKDLYLKVPLGTVVREKDREDFIHDCVIAGEEYLVVKGGKGGKGNASFATPTHRAPRIRQEGQPGEEMELVLELKLIADVGLVGFPNSGKSTLISKISAARPLIADYPFSTLAPHLGVVDVDEEQSFVVADLPGLIEGAHLGHGLGTRFLKHVERTKVLAHLIDVSPYTQREPVEDYKTVTKELDAFNPQLSKRYQILVANKIDLLGKDQSRLNEVKSLALRENLPFYPVSALKGKGLKELVSGMVKLLEQASHKIE